MYATQNVTRIIMEIVRSGFNPRIIRIPRVVHISGVDFGAILIEEALNSRN